MLIKSEDSVAKPREGEQYKAKSVSGRAISNQLLRLC